MAGFRSDVLRKIFIMMWKNLLLRKRHYIQTTMEIILPTMMFVVMIVINNSGDNSIVAEVAANFTAMLLTLSFLILVPPLIKRIVHEKAWVSFVSWHHHGTYIVNGSAIQAYPTKFLELWAVWQLSVWAKIQSSQAHAILKITWKLRPLHKSQYNNTTPINTNMGTTYRVGKELKPP